MIAILLCMGALLAWCALGALWWYAIDLLGEDDELPPREDAMVFIRERFGRRE